MAACVLLPEVMQGQSLAPLLLGTPGYEPRPVILDEFEVDPSIEEWSGRIEIIDGRWGASLEVNPDPDAPPTFRRDTPLLLYDLWNDPEALESLHEERVDLVEKYRGALESQLEAHRQLSERFTPSEESAPTSEQLRALRELGYVN